MRPQTIGRALGIGLRVAGRIAGQRLAAGAQNTGTPSAVVTPAGQAVAGAAPPGQKQKQADRGAEGRAAGLTTKGVARGVSGFLRPFRRVGSIVWLEVTGVFFFLFVAVAASFLWKNRASYSYGAGHRQFVASAAMLVVFLYLGVSSFWRARRR